MAGKTGTTDESRDAWFVGSTPEYTLAVWVGNDDHSPMWDVYGGGLPATIWRRVMGGISLKVAHFAFVHRQKTPPRAVPAKTSTPQPVEEETVEEETPAPIEPWESPTPVAEPETEPQPEPTAEPQPESSPTPEPTPEMVEPTPEPVQPQ